MVTIMRKRLKWFYVSFCLSAVFVLWGGYLFNSDFSKSIAGGPTEVGGSIDTDTTWTLEGSPYDVTNTLTIERGATLSIDPGVTVSFHDETLLLVKGDLSAIGTEADSIIFKGISSSIYEWQEWLGIHFDSCGTNSRLEYCLFEKYYGGEYIILCDNSSPTFSHCTFPHYLPGTNSSAKIIYCINDSSPRIEFSSLTLRDAQTICVSCISNVYQYNQSSSNPIIFQNNFYILDDLSNAAGGGGFLDGNYIFIEHGTGVDTSLGDPVDEIGDGIFTTTSPGCINVDGITNPRAEPNDWQVNVENSEKIESFSIFPNYPNPFNPSTTINFSIPKQSYITLSVYDITGQKVATLIDKHMSTGSHTVKFDGSDLGSGVYLYRLESKGFNKTGKMLLMK